MTAIEFIRMFLAGYTFSQILNSIIDSIPISIYIKITKLLTPIIKTLVTLKVLIQIIEPNGLQCFCNTFVQGTVTCPDTRRPMGSVTAGKLLFFYYSTHAYNLHAYNFNTITLPPYKDPLTYMPYKHKFSYTTKLRESILQVKIMELKTTKIKV